MLFSGAIGLKWGGFYCCDVNRPQRKDIRPLLRESWDFRGSLFFASPLKELTRRRWLSNMLRATKSLHTRTYDRQFLTKKVMPERNNGILIMLLTSFLCILRISFAGKPSPTLISYPALGRIAAFLAEMSRGISKKKTRFFAAATSYLLSCFQEVVESMRPC